MTFFHPNHLSRSLFFSSSLSPSAINCPRILFVAQRVRDSQKTNCFHHRGGAFRNLQEREFSDCSAEREDKEKVKMASKETVTRVTMFKIPKKEDRDTMIKNYEYLKANQKKDGKPYILSLEAGPLISDPRSSTYTFVSKTVFKNLEDFWFYDKDCEAHAWLKVEAKKLTVEGPPLMIYYAPGVDGVVGGTAVEQ